MSETLSDAILYRRARRAYERGRMLLATRHGAVVFAIAAFGMVGCTQRLTAASIALFVGLLAGGCEWRGVAWRRGSHAGLLAGLAPFFLPLGSAWLERYTAGSACPPALWTCIVGGILGGLTLALGDRRRWREPAFWTAAIAVALACDAAGCLQAGLAGLGGMALGLAAGAAPVLVHATTSSR